MDVATVRQLASPDGWALLASLPEHDEATELAVQERLRRDGHSPELVAALLAQSRLRARARDKFGTFVDGMLFTADGLEQATRLDVAAEHAKRFARASLATVHDLGCGIGSDAMAMAALGVTVAAVDADPVTARIADTNLRPWPDSRARVGLAEDFVAPVDPDHARVGVWLDPARRTPGTADITGHTRRVFRLESLSPTWSQVCRIAADVPATGAKLSPSFPHGEIPDGTEAQWVSWHGDLVECVIWWGPLVRTAGRTALVLGPDRAPAIVDEAMAGADPDPDAMTDLADLGEWLHEPDRAVTRAGLLGAVTSAVDGRVLEPGLGFVGSDTAVDLPFARRYAVREAMPFHVKTLRGWLRDRGITGVTIKKRGIRLDEGELRRQLRVGRKSGNGDRATILLTRLGGRQVVLVLDAA